MPYIIAGIVVGLVVGAGMELVTQVTTGEEIDGLSIISAAAGGAVSGAIITACPAAVVSSSVAGGVVERTLDGVLHNESAKDIAVDVGVGAVTDAAFANFGKYVAKTPFVKNAAEAFNATKIGGKIDKVTKKADRYYRSAMSRARNTGTEVHSKTIMNGLISQGKKKLEGYGSKAAYKYYYNGGIDCKKEIKNIIKSGIDYLFEINPENHWC